MQRILQPGEIESLDRIEFPRVRLPQPATLFTERAARLRQKAEGHPIGDYLRFLAHLVDLQGRAAATVATQPVPDAVIEQSLAHGMPVLPAPWRPDPAWLGVLRQLLAGVLALQDLPEALRQNAHGLAARDDAALEALAQAFLTEQATPAELAAQPLVMAALQVVYADIASRLDTQRIAYVDPASICPVCGSAPVVSVLRIGGEAGGHRYLHCGLCATEWHMVRVKCSHCESTKGVRYQGIEGGDPAVLAETCDVCHTYRKQVNQEKDPLVEPLADDLASLTLDLLMADTAYGRASGNPLLALASGESSDQDLEMQDA
ncbi:formate dehydrogenase accessory protein FdhE [Ideonella sp. B7]|uniref:formate dehydrogenase accessory protein FdhE n=1 Tax=Ideonella benzenivorans TaxID=2831643 RepID=UPI001CECA6FB|nr:formate dehydrogenase accessory protein FdhE [Ideonella benzenivorans]MCA6217667.1 formate dehydrogenase accessory protein FdhE [Ideonella benzenivorans]